MKGGQSKSAALVNLSRSGVLSLTGFSNYRLVYFLIKLFNSKRDNPYGGQLVFSNHMLDLMDRDLLLRDQIILISKTRKGTEISSIHKQGARSDKSFKRDYLSGEFGALPNIELNQLDLFES